MSKTVQDRGDIVQCRTNRKPCTAYPMARIPMTMSELEGHFCCYEWQNASRGPSTSAGLLVCV